MRLNALFLGTCPECFEGLKAEGVRHFISETFFWFCLYLFSVKPWRIEFNLINIVQPNHSGETFRSAYIFFLLSKFVLNESAFGWQGTIFHCKDQVNSGEAVAVG